MRIGPAIVLGPLLLALFGVVSHAQAELNSPEARRQWIPSLSAEGGVRVLDSKATVSSPRGDFDGESRALFGFLGVGLQIATPAFFDLPGTPRLFVHGGVATAFDGEARIANEGGPGEPVVPILDNNSDGIPDAPTPVTAVTGQGSTTAAESQGMIVRAGLGLDLSFEWLERQVHVKPSFEWIMQSDRIVGQVGFAESISSVPDECPCRIGFAQGVSTETFHGLGMGLEVEVETGRLGPTMVSVFAGGQAYRLLDRQVAFSGSSQFSDASGPLSVDATYERDPWDYRAAVGVRFHFVPER